MDIDYEKFYEMNRKMNRLQKELKQLENEEDKREKVIELTEHQIKMFNFLEEQGIDVDELWKKSKRHLN